MKREELICKIMKGIPDDSDIKTYAIEYETPRTKEGCANISTGFDCTASDACNMVVQYIRKLAKVIGETPAAVLVTITPAMMREDCNGQDA